jgi:prephenate dehydrogenase
VLGLGAADQAAHELVDCGDASGVATALESAELAVLAVPVGAIRELLPAALARAETVTDCGSTKRAVRTAAAAEPRGERFVPGHPMTGSPEGGIQNASPDLFEDKTWILCPQGSAPDAVARVEALLDAVGARTALMSVEEHDRAVARTSHVPQILASALAVLGAPARAAGAAGPAFERATRVAGGAEAMWRDIFATNADEIAAALVELGAELDAARAALRREPPALEPLLGLLARARAERGRR